MLKLINVINCLNFILWSRKARVGIEPLTSGLVDKHAELCPRLLSNPQRGITDRHTYISDMSEKGVLTNSEVSACPRFCRGLVRRV